MKTLKYKRVLPRDLFNESKLLKVIGHLTMWIEDGFDWMDGVSYVYDDQASDQFICGQDQSDGSFFCQNIKFYVALDVELKIKVMQEIGDAWSAFAQIGDGEEVRIWEAFPNHLFIHKHTVSNEFAELIASYRAESENQDSPA